MDSGLSIGDTMEDREYITHEEWYLLATSVVNLFAGRYGSVGFPGRLICQKNWPINYRPADPDSNQVRVMGYDCGVEAFWYSLQDTIECLTGARFDDDTPRYVMLDYMEERGYIS